MRERIIKELSSKIDGEIAEKLVDKYIEVKKEFIKGNWENTISKSGRFAELVFIALKFITLGKKVKEIESVENEKNMLKDLPKDQFSEEIRLIIPRVASSIIYEIRSKRGVHEKAISPDYIDASLNVSACDWIMAELLRLFYTTDRKQIEEIMKSLVEKKLPILEKFGKMILTVDIEKLMRDMQGSVAIAPEGPVVLKVELPDGVAIKCCLTGAYAGNKLGKLSKDSLLAEDIAKLTGKALKTVRYELPKMVKQGVVDKVGKGEYRITTIGITRFSAEDLPKLKAVSK